MNWLVCMVRATYLCSLGSWFESQSTILFFFTSNEWVSTASSCCECTLCHKSFVVANVYSVNDDHYHILEDTCEVHGPYHVSVSHFIFCLVLLIGHQYEIYL